MKSASGNHIDNGPQPTPLQYLGEIRQNKKKNPQGVR